MLKNYNSRKIYGDELIIGIKEDEKFGKLVMLGLGVDMLNN